ncbi:MAG: hypothetical protein R2774_02235 [Saprospiraceae bacterium]
MYNQPVRIVLIQLLIWIAFFSHCFSQSINTPFGKNRVQYHDDFDAKWMYETQNYITYWYGKSKNVALPTMHIAEMDHDEVQKVLEHKINDKIEILVFTDIADLQQSNIGNEEFLLGKDGEIKVVGNKMLVYFDGDHQHLRKLIRQGTAQVYFNNMMYGTGFQEVLKNSSLINIPPWFSEGIVQYSASHWDMDSENALRQLWFKNKKHPQFKKISEEYPRIAGHSFWYFIDQTYGKSNIPNILYLAKINRGNISAFDYILGVSFDDLMQEWFDYYKDYFQKERNHIPQDQKLILKKSISEKLIPSLCVSPDSRFLVYTTNDKGKIQIRLRNLQNHKETVLQNIGYKNLLQETDYNYPLYAWSVDSRKLTFIIEKYDVLYLKVYDVHSDEMIEQLLPTDFQRVYSISPVNDEDYIFSANQNGFSDLYYYKTKNRNHFPILSDPFDDLDATYTEYQGQKGILFSSNRNSKFKVSQYYDSIPPIGTFDLYFKPDDSNTLIQLTNTPDINETKPIISGKNLYYLSDQSGIVNIENINLSSSEKAFVSDTDRPIISYTISFNNKAYYTFRISDRSQIFSISDLHQAQIGKPQFTPFKQSALEVEQVNELFLQTPKSDTMQYGYHFQSRFGKPILNKKNDIKIDLPLLEISIKTTQQEAPSVRNEPIHNSRITPVNLPFSIIDYSTKLDNDILFEGLESYTSDKPQLLTTQMGILFKAKAKDLYEDYQVELGLRIPTTFNGSEMFAVLDNNRKRIDKRIAVYRKTTTYDNNISPNANIPSKTNKRTLLGLYQWKYPLNIYRSVRLTSSLRHDRLQFFSTDPITFTSANQNEQRLSLKIEYVFDNSYEEQHNLRIGTRYKFFIEAINRFNLKLTDGFSLKPSEGFTTVLGFDARHYFSVFKRSVLALRIVGATTLGSEKILYYIGGVENAVFQKFDETTPINNEIGFAYKVNGYQMRGFDNNIRNGSTFTLSNAELRIPFMQYFLGRYRGSSFIRHMQLTGFFDAGMAWYGASPYSDDNPLNQVQIVAPPLIQLDVTYFRDPIVMSYGCGFRTMILGYFVKIDRAWGIDTRQRIAPKWHFSFGLDF